MYNPVHNDLLEIVMVSAVLGCIIASSIVILGMGLGKLYPLVLVYGIGFPVNFLMEFLATYWYQNLRVTSKSFLIYGNKGNKEFWILQVFTIWEFFIWRSSLFRATSTTWCTIFGVILMGVGLGTRYLSMRTCGESFSHYIETKRTTQVLVTTGIYGIMRHPSYFGYWMFTMGVQAILHNPINTLVDMCILLVFFTKRIHYEERHLEKFYGREYQEYKKRVGVCIPFVWSPR